MRVILQAEEQTVKFHQPFFNCWFITRNRKGVLERITAIVKETKGLNKVECIRTVEGAMAKFCKGLQVFFRMMKDETVRIVVHPTNQLTTFSNDYGALAPCQ